MQVTREITIRQTAELKNSLQNHPMLFIEISRKLMEKTKFPNGERKIRQLVQPYRIWIGVYDHAVMMVMKFHTDT
jgi:hypothetical protein